MQTREIYKIKKKLEDLNEKMLFKFILIALLVSMFNCQLNETQNVSVQPNQLPYPQNSNSKVEITKLKFDINMTADKVQVRQKRFIPIIGLPVRPIIAAPMNSTLNSNNSF